MILTQERLPTIKSILLINICVLAVFHFIFVAFAIFVPHFASTALTPLFDLDSERNIPTFYTGILLLGISIAALRLRQRTKGSLRRTFWTVIAVFFIYWAFDEVFILHERLAQPIRDLLHIGAGSFFYHAWVLVAMVLIGLVGIFVIINSHLKSHPLTKKQLKFLTILLLYMSGIVVLEIVGTKLYGNPQLYRFGIVPLEELFEIGMASYVLIKLLRY